MSRISRGHDSGTNSGASRVLAPSVSLTSGSTLLVWFLCDVGVSGPDGISWGPWSLSVKANRFFGGTFYLYAFTLENVQTGTHDLVLNASAAGSFSEWAFIVTEETGTAAASVDATASASAFSGTTPSSGGATTTAANETLYGAVSRVSGSVSGTWSGGLLSGDTVSSLSLTLEDAYLPITSMGTYAVGKTGVVSAPWCAIAITLKAGGVAGGPDVIELPALVLAPIVPTTLVAGPLVLDPLTTGIEIAPLTTTPVEES